MRIDLHRKWLKKGYSIGVVSVNGKRICESLEDEDRGLTSTMSVDEILRRKKKGQTAIPTGRYRVLWTYSPRFKKMMPLVDGVPGYAGIRIHAGNKAKDTEGCLLLGRNTEVGAVTNSRYWTGKVCAMIEKACKDKEEVTINIHY